MRHSPDMKRSRCAWAGGVAALFLLASCGGGGGGGYSAPSDPSSGLAASTTYAGLCAAPRPSDRQGTLADEKNWLRSWIDETYLWYLDVRGLSAATLDPANAATPIDYFDVLKSPLLTATGNPKDKFHFTYDTPTWVALSQSGIEFGYGFEVALLSAKPPRQAVVAYTDPGTPANPAGIVRGATFLTVDGIDFVNASSKADVDAINAGLFPKAAGTHSFTIMDLGASAPRTVTLSAAALTKTPVQNVMTLPAPNQGIGYLQFNDHVATSEAQLIAAIAQLKAAAVTDLVLDIRYNGGGYLDIASELAYMIAGPAITNGKTFERIFFNDKNPFQLTTAQSTTPFHDVSQGFSGAAGQALPFLGLNRVYVLAGPGLCSASEAIVNGLRGAGVRVDLIGGTTCGKPYGFFATDNCNTTYFAIQFRGVNEVGFGDYTDGFTPTCPVADDFDHQLGDPAEGLLSVAIGYRATGTCVRGTARAQSVRPFVAQGPASFVRSPLRENRFYRDR